MSLARGPFGIEYNPRQRKNESSGLGWLFVLVAAVALVSLIVTWVSKYRAGRGEAAVGPDVAAAVETGEPSGPEPVIPEEQAVVASAVEKRPHQLQVLLMRREKAVEVGDIEMEATTIESIRSLPGSPAADLDDGLARRLGKLNIARLFVKRNARWVKQITVKRGDSASRIAHENGSTLASFMRLNGGSVDTVYIGQRLYVMNHPHFQLVVHRRSRMADLMLADRFFKRYYLTGEVTAAAGHHELSGSFRSFLKTCPLELSAADRAELDLLLPSGTPVLVSEL